MAGEKIMTLEAKVKELIRHSTELKRRAASLEARLREADAKLSKQASELRRFEKEREWLRGRLKKVMGELNMVEEAGENRDQEGGLR